MKKITLSLMAMATLSSSVFAGGDVAPIPVVVDTVEKTGFYVGATLSAQRTYSSDKDWFDTVASQDKAGSLGLLVGYEYNDYLAFEGRVATTVFEEDYAEVTTYSIFVKPQYPVTEEFTVYALLGFGNTIAKGTDAGGLEFGFDPYRVGYEILNQSGFQWGVGIGYDITEDFMITFDYISYANDEDIVPTKLFNYNGRVTGPYDVLSHDALTLGITYKF